MNADDDVESTAEKELNEILKANEMNLSDDIDKTLTDKAKKNQLTKKNVKNLIKNVLINDDVATMLRQTLDNEEDGHCLYEPKLTRAKIREMLETYPPSVHQWSSVQQQSIISEFRLLIEREFSDDSEDEEYKPDKILEEEDDEYDEDESKCTDMNKSQEIEGEIENEMDCDENKAVTGIDDKETIGMRTRSKFSLNDTPLETIEQAFMPPDITEDMYDLNCENDEWREFLSEFTKPLEPVHNDDGEDDPEYNVLCDDDFSKIDKEEFRIDKSVKVTRKEYNALMDELYEFTESFINSNHIEAPKTNTIDLVPNNSKNDTKSKNLEKPISTSQFNNCQHDNNDLSEKSHPPSLTFFLNVQPDNQQQCWNNTSDENNVIKISVPLNETNVIKNPVPFIETNVVKNSVPLACSNVGKQFYSMSSKQLTLLKLQLTQHVQLITQTYMLTTIRKKSCKLSRTLKIMLDKTNKFCKNKKYEPINMGSSLKLIQEWNGTRECFVENRSHVPLPIEMKIFMFFYNEPVFIYPQLLPSKTLSLESQLQNLSPAEENFLLIKIDYVYKKLKEDVSTRVKYRNKELSEMMPTILETVRKRWFSHRSLTSLKCFITRKKKDYGMNSTKNYFETRKLENVLHRVDLSILHRGKRLFEYDIDAFPSTWKSTKRNLIAMECNPEC